MKPVAKGGASRSARNGGGGGRNGGARPGARRGPGWSATGAELGRWMGMPGDDSVSVLVVVALYSDSCLTRTRTTIPIPFGGIYGGAAFAGGAGGMLPGDLAAAAVGTRSNLGKIGDACGYFLPLVHCADTNRLMLVL